MPKFFRDHYFNFSEIKSHPIYSFTVHSNLNKPFLISSSKPFFYMIRRGSNKNDLDLELYNQCLKVGVKFEFGKTAPKDLHINATGSKKAAAYIRGVNFKSDLKDQVHLLLGNKFAYKGYAYLIIINGQGTLATAFKKSKKNNQLEECIKYFKSININISNSKYFASRGSFSLPFKSFNSSYAIGESGGYQDYLFGFGIRMSMASGMAAALSLVGKNKDAKNIYRMLNKKRRISFVNRIMFESLSGDQMVRAALRISSSPDPLSLLSSAYNWNIKNIFRWISLKEKYEVRNT